MPPSDPITVHDEPLAIAFACNAPWGSSGYAQQTALIVPSLRDILGCRMAVSSNYGHFGSKIVWNGIDVYPVGYAQYGNDIAAANAKQHRAHILLTHQDVPWQDPALLVRGGTRWVPWFPIDHTPLSPQIRNRLTPEYCYQPMVLSRFGLEQAREVGLDPLFVPQGIDTTVFLPGDRTAARAALDWPADAFIVGIVATNKGYPNRKAWPQQLRAFRAFAERHSDACLYIHAFGDDGADPSVSTRMAWHLGDDLMRSGRVLWAHPYDLNQGYAQADMVTRYQAFDVLLSASMAEGACLPLFEAQACGVPVISGDWSAMSENTYAGWRVAIEDSTPWYVDPLECEWRLPHAGAIEACLEAAYANLQNSAIRADLAAHARASMVEHHEQSTITDTYWRAALTTLARRIEGEIVPWHVHRWNGIGTLDRDGRAITKCLVSDCPAEAEISPDGTRRILQTGAPLTIAGITLDIQDDPQGGVARHIARECEEVYRLQDLDIPPGGVILDIGAHVGVVSCYLSKRFPQARIIAYEPHPANFERLVRNLDANECYNVECYPYAVTADGRDLTLRGDRRTNTGGYSAFSAGPDEAKVRSVAIGSILANDPTSHISLLKLDCEGAEYEILRAIGMWLQAIDCLITEVHENEVLRKTYSTAVELINFAGRYIPDVRATVITIPEPEAALLIDDPVFLAAEREHAVKMEAIAVEVEASAARKIEAACP